MARHTKVCILFFGSCLFSNLLLLECRKLEGYEFPVYTTDVCPRNQTEWKNRSSAINCTESNGYMCLPNENLTELLEFCYIYPQILVQKNLCLFLEKRVSRVNSYSCRKFTHGCPEFNYYSSEAYIYPSCTELENGCFSAEPNCKRQPLQSENSVDVTKLAIILGVSIPACILLFYLIKKRKSAEKRRMYRRALLFNAEDRSSMNAYKENSIENAIYDQWKQEDSYFISTKACEEVEKLIKSRTMVIVAGQSGSGKSAIIQHIALKYREQGWRVERATKVEDIVNVSPSYLFAKTFLVFDDSFGKESFDEILNNSWQTYEKQLECPSSKVKLLMSCRSHIITDTRIPRYLVNQSVVLDINNEKYKLSVDEKRQILAQYKYDIKLSDKDCDRIVEEEKYFPLLCKLYSSTEYKHKGVRLFTEPVTVLKEEILELRKRDRGKFCALALLVLFNDDLCVNNLLENKDTEHKFKHTLELCGLSENTPRSDIEDNLDFLKGFLVKKVEHKYHFYHDLVKEVTTQVFETYYPAETIDYADIGLFRRRIQIGDCEEHNDPLTFYLSDIYTEKLGKRFLIELIGNRFIDLVLNPSMKNKKVIEALKKIIHKNPYRHELLFEKKELKLKKPDYFNRTLAQLTMSKLFFISLEKDISPLFVLIVFGHTDFSLECLNIQQQNLPNSIDSSLIYAVCCNGSLKMFQLFFKDRAEKSLKKTVYNTWGGLHPIHILSLYHNYEILKELIMIGIDINYKSDTKDGWTPLHLAVSNDTQKYGDHNYEESGATRRDNTVQFLLSNGADINLCTKEKISSLFIACQNGHYSTVQLLLSKGADISLCTSDRASPLYIACQNGHDSIVKLLLSNGADIDLCTRDRVSPLHKACLHGHFSIVQHLLRSRANINVRDRHGSSPLHNACENGHDSTAQILLVSGAKINLRDNYGCSPLHKACLHGHYRIVQHLLSSGAKINLCDIGGFRPLHNACQNGHDSTAQFLLSSGANINLCSKNGYSPLHFACQNGHESTVRLLLSSGADIDLCHRKGYSPLHYACENGHDSIAQFLLSTGANINLCGKNGYSPLHFACHEGHDRIVQHLLSNGANINLCSKDGYSPLFNACENGHESTVQLLLRNKAEIILCMENETSPLYIAYEKEYENIAQLLQGTGTPDD